MLLIVAACTTTSELSTPESEKISIIETSETTVDDVSDFESELIPDRLSLASLEAFQTPPDGWSIYGKVYTSFPGEPLRSIEGSGILMFEGQSGEEGLLLTRKEHGDANIELEFMLQADSCFSLLLQGRYEINLCGSPYKKGSDSKRTGKIHYGDHTTVAPLVDASRAPGVWQRLFVDFSAPQFDESGRKSGNARIDRIRLNGETIHRSIELPQVSSRAISTSEVAEAPLALRADSVAAFRNIGIYDEQVHITNLHYAYHEENLDDDKLLAEATPVRESSTSRITAVHASRGNNFALRYSGTLEVPETGTYKFTSIARGKVTLQVDGRTLLQPTPQPDSPIFINLTDRVDGAVELEAGQYPFTLQYKKRQSGTSSLSVFVTGPGIRQQKITSAEGAWRSAIQSSPMPVEPDRRTVVMRSHLDHLEKMVLNAVSVGDPEGVHYSLDVGNAALLQFWHDTFLDAGSIWTGRGMNPDTRMVAAVGIPESKITLSGRPVVAFLQDSNEVWPDSIDSSYRFSGYANDESGRPTFRYRFDNLEVHEKLRPGQAEHANSLIREISVERIEPGDNAWTEDNNVWAGENTWILLADGSRIERRADGIFSVDDKYFLEVPPGFDIHHRRSDGRDELILQLPVSSQTSSFTTTLNW